MIFLGLLLSFHHCTLVIQSILSIQQWPRTRILQRSKNVALVVNKILRNRNDAAAVEWSFIEVSSVNENIGPNIKSYALQSKCCSIAVLLFPCSSKCNFFSLLFESLEFGSFSQMSFFVLAIIKCKFRQFHVTIQNNVKQTNYCALIHIQVIIYRYSLVYLRCKFVV